jgi:heptaprenylglyceryl phosphate synthase
VAAGTHVLLIGFDPNAIPGVDAAMVEMAIAMGEERLRAAGFDTEYCLVAPDEKAEGEMIAALRADAYDCVVVGGGIRKPEPFVELFELVVNLIRQHAPDAAIAFNSTGENSLEAVLRWLPSPRSGV